MSTPPVEALQTHKEVFTVPRATVRLAGDSGDGMQLVGSQLTNISALAGNDIATFPDFPAEIRAPRGTQAGVSGFQLQFASEDIFTPGDQLDTLVVMNPAALVTNIGDLLPGGTLIVNDESFTDKDLKLANLKSNPLDDVESLSKFKVVKVPLTSLTRKAVEGVANEKGEKLGTKEADRCKNFFALGLVCWLYGRDLDPTIRFLDSKFGKKRPEIAEANVKALKAGWFFGETAELFERSYQVEKAELEPGTYANIMGNEALAWGLVTAAHLSGKELFYGSYPITPASPILEELSTFKNFRVKTFQAEDEIAAICSAIGAAYGGAMGITGSSGPGIALKGEAMGLAMILELPLIVLNVQRGGPSTGLPTKTEQSDLLQALCGRNGESPLPIIASRSPSDCFGVAIDAWRIATKFMVPVIVLSDGYIANGSEPWKIPEVDKLEKIPVSHPGPVDGDTPFLPYARNEFYARPWAIPGTPGLMHRVGGLEKQDGTGNVSYDPENHQRMTDLRQAKVDKIADVIGDQEVNGPETGDLLVLSWGGTFGACKTAVERSRRAGLSVAHTHLRWLNPLPKNLGQILKSYKRVLIPELNLGQLRMVIRAKYLVDAVGLNKVKGKPFQISELMAKIQSEVNSL